MNPSQNEEQKTASSRKDKSITAQFKGGMISVEDHQDARIIYDNGYYGTLQNDKTLQLNFEESLHLIERGVIIIKDVANKELSLSECVKLFSEINAGFWKDYLVYKDLRNRGYIVGQGISELVKYRLYPRGAKIGQDTAKTLICPLAEGRTIDLKSLNDLVIQTQSLKKKLLIACVDRLGDVSYYELQPLFK